MILNGNLVLSLQEIGENNGRLCYKNVVSFNNVSATSETMEGPVTNLANPSTAFYWQASSSADQTITITLDDSSPIDYVGIARHNLYAIGAEIRIRFNGITVEDWQAASSAQALLLLFESGNPSTIQIDIRNAGEAPRIAVLYVGESIALQRKIYVGHTPITYGRNRTVLAPISQSGEYLGEIELNRTVSTTVSIQNLTASWYRETLDDFFAISPRVPCFWAWRPEKYPAEVSYCWVVGNPRPTNQRANGMMSVDWDFEGIA